MNQRISIKRIIIDLLFIKEQVLKHFKDDEKYQVLLNFITAKDYLDDNDIPIPTFKEIEKQTGIKMYHIRKQLLEIYEELFDEEKEYVFSFNQCEINLIIKYRNKFTNVKCISLNHIPRIGENIDLPFVKAKVGCDFFYVNDIRHNFYDKKQTIDIYLKCGIYNSYWHNRLHEAKEKRELSLNDFYDLSDYQLKRKLLPQYHR